MLTDAEKKLEEIRGYLQSVLDNIPISLCFLGDYDTARQNLARAIMDIIEE